MNKIFKTTLAATVLGLTALAMPTSQANAFFGWNDGNGFGNGFGNGNGSGNMGFSMNFSGKANGNAQGNGYNGWNGANRVNGANGYAPAYGFGAPVFYGPTTAAPARAANGYAPYPVAPFNPYARPQAPAQVAPQAKVQAQPTK